jgi:hypothetical protein
MIKVVLIKQFPTKKIECFFFFRSDRFGLFICTLFFKSRRTKKNVPVVYTAEIDLPLFSFLFFDNVGVFR